MQDVKKSFLLYLDQGEQVSMLSDTEAGKLIKALFEFALNGNRPSFQDGMTQMCFSFISAQIARDAEAYREKCQRLSVNAKKGRAGATRRGEQLQANASNCKQKQAIAVDTDTEYDTETETVTLDDTEYATENEAEYEAEYETEAPREPMTVEEARLSVQDRLKLLRKGIPITYIDTRAERAELHGAPRGMLAYEILLGWWQDDRNKAPWKYASKRKRKDSSPPCSAPYSTAVLSEDQETAEDGFLKDLWGS